MAGNQLTQSRVTEPAGSTTGESAAELREIAVFTDDHSETNILEFAGLLAEEQGARLIDVFMQPAPAVTTAQSFARGTGIREVIEENQSELEGIEAHHRSLFDDIVRRHGIQSRSEWRSLTHWSSEVGVHAYYADLVVIARPERADQVASPPDLAESLVLSSGRPIILFPPGGKASRVRRVLVAWNTTRESIRAAADALPLVVKADAVEILIVDSQDPRAGHGQEPGADIARHLARHGAHVEVQRISSGGQDVGHLLLSRAAAFRADLVVMGAYGHSQLREWMFGGVTRTVLYKAGLPVLMSR
jgi:nucleotide-binding universal stress UspA family protein